MYSPVQSIDLRTTKCPLNFVKTKLALEKLAKDDVLEVWIALDGQSAINIPNSIRQEGHEVLGTEDDKANGLQKIWIRRQ